MKNLKVLSFSVLTVLFCIFLFNFSEAPNKASDDCEMFALPSTHTYQVYNQSDGFAIQVIINGVIAGVISEDQTGYVEYTRYNSNNYPAVEIIFIPSGPPVEKKAEVAYRRTNKYGTCTDGATYDTDDTKIFHCNIEAEDGPQGPDTPKTM